MEDYSHLRGHHRGEEESESLLDEDNKHSPEDAKKLLAKLKEFSGYIEEVTHS